MVGRGGEGTEPPPPPKRGDDGGDGKRIGRTRTAACPQRGTGANTNSVGTKPRHTDGTDGTRPKHGALARHKYGLMALPGSAVDPADMGDQEIGDGHGATGEAADQA